MKLALVLLGALGACEVERPHPCYDHVERVGHGQGAWCGHVDHVAEYRAEIDTLICICRRDGGSK